MVEMEIEDLITHACLCGVWMDASTNISVKKLSLILRRIPFARYIAFCLINENSLSLAEKLKELQAFAPSYRIIAISNDNWYSNHSLTIQNAILKMRDQADIMVRCSFPAEDALKALLLFSDYVIYYSKQHKLCIANTDKINDFTHP